MYKYENSITGNATINKICELYENVERWSLWDDSMERVELNGVFEDNTKGTMYIYNMPPLPF